MRKIITGLVLLAILGGAAYLLSQKDEKQEQVNKIMADRDFTVEKEDIHKLFIAHKTMKPYTLTRKGSDWYYGDDKFKINEYVIPNILNIFSTAAVKFIPPRSQVETVINSMRKGGIKVEVYGKGDQLLKTMYIGSEADESGATYMMLEGSSQPYVMELPHLRGGFKHLLMLSQNQLRDPVIVNYEADEIASVKVDYPGDRSNSFELRRDGGDYRLYKMGNNDPVIPKTEKVKAYLGAMNRIALEGWDNGNEAQDSIAQLTSFADVSITGKDGRNTTLKLIPFRDFIDPDINIEEYEQSKYVNRYFTVLGDGELGVSQQRLVGKLLLPYSFFVED